jgi:hypothetical protein
MLRGFFQIAINTVRENLREPIFFLITASALVIIGLFPTLTLFVFREQIKLVVDSAMATGMLFGLILSVLCATHAVTREIERGTAITVLAKPVTRTAFILGKMAGICLVLLVFKALTTMATLLAVRAATDQFYFDQTAILVFFGVLVCGCLYGGIRNYIDQASFPMHTVLGILSLLPIALFVVRFLPPEAGKSPMPYNWQILRAEILTTYAVLAMGILATALSTRLDLTVNMTICACVFVLGSMSDYLLGRQAAENLFAAVAYALVPNWQLFWMADALAADRAIPWGYIGFGAAYLVAVGTIFALLALALFQDREVGLQNIR